MTSLIRKTLVPALAIGAALGAATGPASAENLFRMLFGGGIQQRQAPEPQRPTQPQQRSEARAPKPIAKVAAPSYRTYKADAMAAVSFKALLEAPQTVSFEPSLDGFGFAEAVAGLAGFDLAAEKAVARAIESHYAAHRDFVWVTGSSANARAVEAVAVLSEAGDYGLDPADYAVALPAAGFDMTDMPARMRALIRFEMTLSARVLRYVRDAHGGRVDPNRISGYYDFPEKPLDLAAALDQLSRMQEVRSYLESRHPQNERYAALRAELKALRAAPDDDVAVDPRLLLKPGGSSPDLPAMLALFARETDEAFRAEHAALLSAHAASQDYVQELVPLVKAAQGFKGLATDGVIGPRTVAAFAGVSRADRIAKVEVALEQLRWHPSDLGSPRVFINQPAFTATYNEGGVDRLTMRVVIGKVSNQTSFFFDEIDYVEYNPYWGVPQSIIVNEMLPKLREDPGYLDRAGYEVTDRSGRRIPSSSINWWNYGGKVPYSVRQTPSEANALGELKIMFPNKHAIYMHDTPSKSLFQRDVRAFSHGCVRLSDPRGMAAAVLGKPVQHVADKIDRGHSSEKLGRKVPVYVAYFTAWPDQDGKVAYFEDVYDRDARLRKALEATAEARAPSS
jgi:murein L,D-transpeptidase YcbB/YkuD